VIGHCGRGADGIGLGVEHARHALKAGHGMLRVQLNARLAAHVGALRRRRAGRDAHVHAGDRIGGGSRRYADERDARNDDDQAPSTPWIAATDDFEVDRAILRA
jgi:hypothetical protein